MPYSYFRLFLVALLCHQPARPLLRSYIVSSKALLSQLIAAKNGITTGVTIRQRVHAATDPASTLTESPFEASGMSYSSLLVHYLSQNVKPKFGLCLSVMSKIVEHEGPDAAIRTSEFLKCNISAEGFHMANKALLSALVMQRHLEAASSHLRRLLLDQSEHRQVDATVVADLLQLHMAVDIHHNTTKVRRKYKKRAVEASSLYSDILGTQLLSSEEFPHLNGVGVGMDETYGDPTAKLTSGSAINRIHEYGARALAASREWEQAVSAVGRIEDRHLSRPQMVSFCTQLLDRLVALNMPVAPQPLAVQSAAPGEVSSDVSERSVSDTGCDGSAALEFSLSLPLQHMPADSPLLHAALLVMSAFPSHAEAVIALLHGSFSRRSNTHTNTHNTAADGHSHTTFFPEEISLKLTKQLFIGGCSADNLLLAMKMLWGDQLLQSGLENVGSPASHDDGNVSLYGAYDTSETSLQLAVDAVQGVINAACALRDLQGTETDESQKAQISQESVADLPATILRALTPHGTAPDASEGTAPSRGMSSADIDTSSTPPLPIPHTRSRSRPDPLLRALSPSLHCLCIALRLSGQRHRIGAVLQSVGDAYLEAGRQSYLRSGAESSQVNHPDTVPQQGQGQGEGDSAAADDAVWAPSLELMVEALDLTGDVGKDGYIEPLAVYREAALRVRNGQEVLPCVLSALFRDATLSCLSLQQSRPDTAAPSEPTAAIGAAAGAGAGVIAAAKVLWSTMVQAGLPFCYKSGPVLSSALLFMFTVGDSRSDSSQMSPVGEGTQGSMDGVGRDLGPMHGLQDRDSGSTSLGIQACLDAVAVAASTAEARTHEGVLDTVLEDIFSLLLRMRGTLRDSSELEDAPRAVLSLMLQSGGALRGGMQIGAREGHVGVRVEGLLLGAVLSLGGPSSNPRGSSASEGGSEGCAYRYSSLLRLSLYLSTVPETVLQTLVPALFRRGTAWPKVILKAFSHLYSSRRIALDPRMPYSAAAAPPLSATPSKSSLVRIVLEAFDLLLVEELSVPATAPVSVPVPRMDSTHIDQTPLPLAPPTSDPPVPHSSSLQDAFQRYNARTNPPPTVTPTPTPTPTMGRHVTSSATLAAAIDLCSSMRQLEGAQGAGIEQGPVGKQKQGTKKNSIEGQGNRGRVVEGKGEVEGEKESGADDTYTRCKLYYSIGWLSAELAAKSLLESDQRHLGVSLNQLSFALLRAAQRLDRPTAEAMLTVRHKIEFFATKMTASFVSETESVSIPVDAKAGAEKSAEEGTTSGLALTRVAAAAVTYRETRLLSAIATADSRGREQLMHFWSSVVTANPSLMGYSTALFELLDSHMAAGNGTGAIAWAKVSLKGGMLPPMRVKELLIRYSVTTSLHCLPALLPLLSKLSTSQSDLEFEDGLTSYDTPVLYRRGGGSDLFLPLPMSVLRTLSVTLLEQHRLGDARVLLKCVHPFQWPYDELLLALATASSIAGTNIDNVGEKGSEGRKRECTAVLRKREELSLSLSLNPISSSTAKALLAMHTDAGTPERKGEKAEKVAEDSDSEQTFRIMVARAVKSGGKDGPSRTASASAVLGGDNNNGRSLSSISSNALSEDDVRSGLLALLTLYSLTDSGSTSSVAQEQTADSASAVGVADASPVDDGGMSSGLEGNIAPPPPTSKWVDPESPENLAKFLSDVQNLGARSTQSSSTGSTRASSRGMLSKQSTTVGWREEGVEGGVVDRDRAESRSSSVGLRVSGSKKSWKRASAFGSSFDKTARSTTSLYSPSLDLSAATSPALTAQSAATAAAADFDSAAAGAGEGVDEIVCRELARSLLSAVTSQISALERLTVHEEGEAEEGDIQQRSADGAAASRLGGQSEWQRGKQRRVVRAAEEKQYQSIEGAVAELFSLSNQQQADRLFRTFRDTPALCARLLHLCALRRDPGAAAVVLSQMAYQHTLSETLTQDPEMWQTIRSIMVNSTRTGKRSDEDRDRDRHTDRSQHQSLSSLEVWVDVKKMFSAVRPFVLRGLRVGLEDGVGVGVGGSPPRDALSAILEVGILSHLESLRDSGDNEQTRHGDTQSDDLDLDLDTGAGTGAADHESSEEHWMKAGEREKLKTRSAAKQHLSSTERAKAVLSSRTDTLELVQRLPSLGLSLSDGLGSKLICAFLTVSDDVDAPLSILNILLRTGGHASDEACEQLAKKLLSRRRQAMARAICSLMHSRGRLCDTSFYAFLFASILSPQLSNGVRGLPDLVTSPPRGLGEQDDREREIERLRLAGGDAYGDTDRNMELRSGGRGREGDLGPDLGPGPGLASPAVAEALVLLEEVMQGVIASRKARANGTGTGDSTSEGSSEIKFLKIASNLIEILSRLGYGDQGLVAVYGAIERMKRLRTM